MKLIRVNQNTTEPHYLNIDYIVRLGKDKNMNYWACTSEHQYLITEEAYNDILAYGKANKV